MLFKTFGGGRAAFARISRGRSQRRCSEFDEIVQRNSSTSEELASAAEELARQASQPPASFLRASRAYFVEKFGVMPNGEAKADVEAMMGGR